MASLQLFFLTTQDRSTTQGWKNLAGWDAALIGYSLLSIAGS